MTENCGLKQSPSITEGISAYAPSKGPEYSFESARINALVTTLKGLTAKMVNPESKDAKERQTERGKLQEAITSCVLALGGEAENAYQTADALTQAFAVYAPPALLPPITAEADLTKN